MLIVVVFHANSRWMGGGWAAVDAFFGLSGFLITSILLKHGDSPRFLVQSRNSSISSGRC